MCVLAQSISIFVSLIIVRHVTHLNQLIQLAEEQTLDRLYIARDGIMIGGDVDPHSYILHMSEFNALICRACQHGLTRKGVARHFQRHHKSIPYDIRKQLDSFASGLLISNSNDIILPSVEIEAIEGLEVIEGFACQMCTGLYGTLESIRQHSRKQHGWVKSHGIDVTLKWTDLNRTDVAGSKVTDVL